MHARAKAFLSSAILSLICLNLSLPHTAAANDPISAFIDSYGYGYEVKITINGIPINVIKGKGQQATRLFSADHPMLAEASEEQKSLFLLREGENSLVVEFRKLDEGMIPLQVKLEIPKRYSKPLFHLTTTTRRKGTIERKFRIDKTMPVGFKTIEVNDGTI